MHKSVYTVAYGRMLARLVQVRRSAGLNQALLAEKLGQPQSFVSQIETGERRIDMLELIAICHHLRTDPADVIVATCYGTSELSI